MAKVAKVDVFTMRDRGRLLAEPPSDQPVHASAGAERPLAVPALRRWAAWLRPAGLPLELAGRDPAEARSHLASFVSGRYQLVWVDGAEILYLLGQALPPGPLVLDVGDLEDLKAVARARNLLRDAATPQMKLRSAPRAGVAARNARAWRRLQRDAVRTADRIVTVSRFDAERLSTPLPVNVVPNGSDDPGDRRRCGHRLGEPPTIVFPGLLTYPPNADAARVLVEQIGPHLWASRPDLRIRLIGRADDRVRQLQRPPRVEVTGWVDDLTAELANADAVIVPLRYGGGTRIKIIEAWAHAVPVVSTAAGAEGLDAVDGDDILLADEPAALAASCTRLLADEQLRDRLAAAGRARFLAGYDWQSAEAEVARITAELTGP
jgi:glycosyltransferase involved in cell wall biosynthesis